MTTTARQSTRRVISETEAITALVLLGLEFDLCQLCTQPAAELFTRIDNRDGSSIECCEHCADTADVSPVDE